MIGECNINIVKVKVYCGFNVYYTSDILEEPGECEYEDIIEVNKEDWEDGIVSHECIICKNELTQYMDHLEEIK